MNCNMPDFFVLQSPQVSSKLMSTELMMPSNHLNLLPLSPPALNFSQHQNFFQMSWFFASGGQSIGASALASVVPINIQSWSPLVLTGLISLCPKDSQESSPAPQLKSINSLGLSLLSGPTLTCAHDYWKNHSFDYMDLCWQSGISAF